MYFGAFATLSSVLNSKQSLESGMCLLVSSVLSLTQLVSPSVALIAKLIIHLLTQSFMTGMIFNAFPPNRGTVVILRFPEA